MLGIARAASSSIPRHFQVFAHRRVHTVPLAFDKWESRTPAAWSTPIIILHGLFGSKLNNRSVARSLARDLKTSVYCLDLRNHGDSPHDPRHDYKAMAADVARFMHDHDVQQPIVIGHSMGAKAAMALALTSPDEVSACIPVDNSPMSIRLSSDFPRYVEGMIAVERAECTQQKDMVEVIKPYCGEAAVQMFLLANFKRDDEGIFRSRIPLETLARSLGHVADFDEFSTTGLGYNGPTLLIRGTRSNFVPDESLPLMGQLFPRFVVRDIDSGHWVISEKPKEFVEEVERFLEKDE